MTDLRLSNSERAQFMRCRRKWWLSTFRALKPAAPELPGTPTSIGTLVHDALAAYYDPEVKADPVAYAEDVATRRMEEVPEFVGEVKKEIDLVRAMLAGYLEWLEESGADQDIQVLGTERMVEVPLAQGITLLSKLDAPVQRASDGARLAFEHKTVTSLEQPLIGLKIDSQLLTEHLALFLDARLKGATDEDAYEQCHGILYNMLRKVKRTATAKPPFYDRVDIPHNIHELRAHWYEVVAVAREIQATRARLEAGESHHTAAPKNATRDCKWDCPFFKVCVMFDDGSDAEGALAAMYETHDPLERYAQAKRL